MVGRLVKMVENRKKRKMRVILLFCHFYMISLIRFDLTTYIKWLLVVL